MWYTVETEVSLSDGRQVWGVIQDTQVYAHALDTAHQYAEAGRRTRITFTPEED